MKYNSDRFIKPFNRFSKQNDIILHKTEISSRLLMVIRYRYATFDYSSTCRQRRNSRFGVIAINFRIERASAYVDRTKPLSYFGLILNMADVPTHAIIASNSRPHKQHQRVTLYAKNTHDLYAGAISDVVGRKADYFLCCIMCGNIISGKYI